MDIEAPEKQFQNVSYNDSSFEELAEYLNNHNATNPHHLSLFLGMYAPNKRRAVEHFAEKLNRNIRYVDTSDLIYRVESESIEAISQFFSGFKQTEDILYFKNANELAGIYVGNSQSQVKYATPAERYFLKEVKKFNGLVILDIEEFKDADKTLRRASKSVVSFTLPDSKLQRFWWHLKNYSFNGNDLNTVRPEAYK